ncbi:MULTISPECIES: ABC transporter ATP-binding protein [Brevibacillus]|uniref:ABC transporter ATP-binding protein n=1 Tax=Brevibacillus TaxID=55080 RepID=UPI000D0EEFF9|nr:MULTISPECIES: ABC transporter ATP-binding protein [Brevibacillus]MED1945038.1 ABC transporter ATP-binding protein [Brevibacillus formosus]MED1996275.1 ABC transporter ATP-binding protein [Brevibacillus formosus]MED2081244.1 ABC transporter ATP-binding protein [Brevibacillus formosus]PSK14308.1 ABC transporter ATP-binding protein [Brevibacillus sp. NRRL NRS-603]
MAEVELRRISKMYGGQKVVNEVSARILPGEFFVLVGPSGCGKSTTLRMIAGLEEISTGELLIGGKPMNQVPPSERNISMVFQNYALYPHLTVKDNILFGLQVRKVDKAEQGKRLERVAEMLGIAHLLQRKPKELSGGQRQRVALGRAIVSQHPICLMDEPLSNLDAKLRGHMRTEIRRLQQELGITMIYVTHDQVEAMTMADRMMVLRDGEVQQVGKPLDVYNHPANLFVAEFTGAPPMNTVPTIWQAGDQAGIVLEGQHFLPLPMFHGIKDQTPVVLGLRPESLQPALEGQSVDVSCQFPVTVQGVEILGSETIVEFTVGDKLWKAKWNGQWHCKRGETMHVRFDPAQVNVFDGETGKNLAVTTN